MEHKQVLPASGEPNIIKRNTFTRESFGWLDIVHRCGRGRQEKCCVGVLCGRIIYSVGMCVVRGVLVIVKVAEKRVQE